MKLTKTNPNFNLKLLAKGDILKDKETNEEYVFLKQNGESSFICRHKKTGHCVSKRGEDLVKRFEKVYAWTDWRKDPLHPDALYRTNRKDIQYKLKGTQIETHCHNDDVFNLETGLQLARKKWMTKVEKNVGLKAYNNKDIKGARFGDYKVIDQHGLDSGGYIVWHLINDKTGKELFCNRSRLDNLMQNNSDNSRKDAAAHEKHSYVFYTEYQEDILNAPFFCDIVFSIATDFEPHSKLTKTLFDFIPYLYHLRNNYKIQSLSGQGPEVGDIYAHKNIIALILNEPHSKPNMDDLKIILKDLALYCQDCKIEHLAMPKIGCGRGQFDWDEVKSEIIKAFNDIYKGKEDKINIRFYV